MALVQSLILLINGIVLVLFLNGMVSFFLFSYEPVEFISSDKRARDDEVFEFNFF